MIKKWNNFWFKEHPVINLAICRIFIVGFAIIYLILSKNYLIESADLPGFLYNPIPAFDILVWFLNTGFRPGNELLLIIFWTSLLSGTLALFGLFNKISLWLFLVGNLFLYGHAYSYGDIHHPEALIVISLFLLALSPSGLVFSIDEIRSKSKKTFHDFDHYIRNLLFQKNSFAWWPILTIQLLLSMVYFDAGISKLLEGGVDWMNGYTLQYYLAQDSMRWGSDIGYWFSQQHFLAQLGSIITLIFELTFFILLFFPKLAFIYLPVGVGMHLGIYLTMKAPFFSFMVLYSVFIPWETFLNFILGLVKGNKLNEVDKKNLFNIT